MRNSKDKKLKRSMLLLANRDTSKHNIAGRKI